MPDRRVGLDKALINKAYSEEQEERETKDTRDRRDRERESVGTDNGAACITRHSSLIPT